MTTTSASDLIAGVPAEVAALARVVSFAVRVDPGFLRAARLQFFPASDAGLEADLWLSPLVKFRMPSGVTLDDHVARELRQRFWNDDRAGYERAWTLTRTRHTHLSTAIQLEEELSYLEPRDDSESGRRVTELLQKALAAMVAGNHKGLAHWAARALPRLSERLRSLEPAQMLAAGATIRLGGRLAMTAGETAPEWMSWVMPGAVPRITVGIRLLDGGLEIGDPERLPGSREIRLPQTEPMLLTVVQGTSAEQTVEIPLRLEPVVRVPISQRPVKLRTLLGETYLLDARAGAAAERRAAEILDMRPDRERHRNFAGRARLLSHIDSILAAKERPSPWIVIAGGEGSGKSAVVAQVLTRLETGGIFAPHHFFNRWVPAHRDPQAAVMSICAQIERRFPDVATSEFHPRTRLSGLLGRIASRSAAHEKQKTVIVLDGLDQIDPLSRTRLRDYLPAHVAEGASFLASTAEPDALPDLTGRGEHVLIDLDQEWRDPDAMLEFASKERLPIELSRFSGFAGWQWLAVRILAGWASDPRGMTDLAMAWAGVQGLHNMINVAVELALREPSLQLRLGVIGVSREAIAEDVAGRISGAETPVDRFAAGRALIQRRKSARSDYLMPVSSLVEDAIKASAPMLAHRAHEAMVEHRQELPPEFWLRQGLHHAMGAGDRAVIGELCTDVGYIERRVALEGTGHVIEELQRVAGDEAAPEPAAGRSPAAPRLFISYRHDDAPGVAGRLHEELTARYGSDQVFRDIDIRPGVPFPEYITSQMSAASALLVVIGRQWARAADRRGRRRIDGVEDAVRTEIREALRRDVPVIPVLVDDASMPTPEELPSDIRALAKVQAIELRAARWGQDVARLIEALDRLTSRGTRRQRRPSRGGEAV